MGPKSTTWCTAYRERSTRQIWILMSNLRPTLSTAAAPPASAKGPVPRDREWRTQPRRIAPGPRGHGRGQRAHEGGVARPPARRTAPALGRGVFDGESGAAVLHSSSRAGWRGPPAFPGEAVRPATPGVKSNAAPEVGPPGAVAGSWGKPTPAVEPQTRGGLFEGGPPAAAGEAGGMPEPSSSEPPFRVAGRNKACWSPALVARRNKRGGGPRRQWTGGKVHSGGLVRRRRREHNAPGAWPGRTWRDRLRRYEMHHLLQSRVSFSQNEEGMGLKEMVRLTASTVAAGSCCVLRG